MIRNYLSLAFFNVFIISALSAQMPDSCKLNIGTNLNGITDFGTEIPFVDLMHASREWYTKSIGDPAAPFDSGFGRQLNLRPDGYPTHVPQAVNGSTYMQQVLTIWGSTDGWPVGEYTVLWDGTGTISFFGAVENLQQTSSHRIIFDFTKPVDGIVELKIEQSDILDPIRNIRVLMPGTEFTYMAQPFYSLWLDKVDIFESVRFMDWGQTNNWGLNEGDGFGDSTLVDWADRSQMDHYTWAYNKGVPYEMMVKLMNDYDKDGWFCIPHSASEDYVRNMASHLRDNLESDRHIYVEYSNEIWNWIFQQTHWANEFGCIQTGETWPEGTTKYIQRVLDYWTDEFDGQLDRTTRIVGIFTGWLDVAQRVAFNINPNSFDAVSPTYYFGFNEDLEPNLDNLGTSATIADVAQIARQSMNEHFSYISDIKTELADSLGKPMAFYEGGQHMTPMPFGVVPTYADALVAIHRDTSMYNLYNEWFDKISSLQEGNEPLLLMNFSFVAPRTSQFGAWGILETMDQDFSITPAPKYQSVLEHMAPNTCEIVANSSIDDELSIRMVPNPTTGLIRLEGVAAENEIFVYNALGVLRQKMTNAQSIDLADFPKGIYFVGVQVKDKLEMLQVVLE